MNTINSAGGIYSNHGQTTKVVAESKLPSKENNEKVKDAASHFVKNRNIYWMPHPKFNTTSGKFPNNAVDICDTKLYGLRAFCQIFDDQKLTVIKESKNNKFFEWLNKEESVEINDSPNKIIFMNCIDFVYLSLFTAGLLSKKHIIEMYNAERANSSSSTPDPKSYYGCHFDDFEDFDPHTSTAAQPGDILLGFNEQGKPIHLMILGEDEKCFSLWNQETQELGLPENFSKYCASHVRIDRLQKSYFSLHVNTNHDKVHFKRCDLNKFLNRITQH